MHQVSKGLGVLETNDRMSAIDQQEYVCGVSQPGTCLLANFFFLYLFSGIYILRKNCKRKFRINTMPVMPRNELDTSVFLLYARSRVFFKILSGKCR